MAISTDHQDQIHPPSPGSPSKSKLKPKLKPEPPKPEGPKSQSTHPKTQIPNPNPNSFTFWLYFTVSISFITLLFVSLSSLSPQDPKTWFLSLPTSLRTHFSKGRAVKVQINRNEPPIEVFTYSQGPKNSENLLILHGLGCSSFTFSEIVDDLGSNGVFAVAVDLPGSGFSDKTVVKERENVGGGVLGGFWDVVDEIREKGVFYHFDHLIEHGGYASGEKTRVSTRKVVEPVEMGSLEVGRVLGQVVESMGLAPLHLVLHDSALVLGANWVVENAALLRSLTLIDTMPSGVGMALPLWVFEMPVVREVALGVDFVFRKVLDSCCSKMVGGSSSVEAHRVLLKGRDGRKAVVAMGRKLNQSFDLGEWASTDAVKSMPIQVIWSSSWSEEWSEEGRRVAEVVSQAKLVKHFGGRWPQDDTSSEVAGYILSFVSSLPKTDRKSDEEPLPDHIQKMLDEAKIGGHHHYQHGHGSHSHHGGHDHGHAHAHAGYMDSYGLGQGHGWGM